MKTFSLFVTVITQHLQCPDGRAVDIEMREKLPIPLLCIFKSGRRSFDWCMFWVGTPFFQERQSAAVSSALQSGSIRLSACTFVSAPHCKRRESPKSAHILHQKFNFIIISWMASVRSNSINTPTQNWVVNLNESDAGTLQQETFISALAVTVYLFNDHWSAILLGNNLNDSVMLHKDAP